ncbi:Developmental and secondary metabolism regulator veA like [Actinidia chinensis var. chinensis]|uniref:Developmental and secondary metabolism regulator veA like n=1 Tax=Actinidia chinensis var. chinensis TaxID=1590841 RepID=A0A2R6PGX3_ACTCC|nr:Developmental and secondary metabolism regulator veA like [Actinidia chinensis var. chinensis]
MDPPPPLSTNVAAAAAAAALNYPDSVDSSPRSRNTDSWGDHPPVLAAADSKLRLMCSYGGHIVPRPHDKSLCYVGGDTRIVVADRHGSLADLHHRLSKTLPDSSPFTLKYQLPNEDLDSLISVTTDEDFENMVDEYDRLAAAAAGKSSRIRLFLFPAKPDSASSIGSLLEDSTKSEDWFVNALNGTNTVFSESASVNCLLGLDDDVAGNSNSQAKDAEARLKGVGGNSNKMGAQDVHSVPDSPMLETTSSFGSTSSSPSLANLPPIRVREDQKAAAVGIEEQFAQMGVAAAFQKQEDGAFMAFSSPPAVLTTVATATAALPNEYPNRVFCDDERSEHGYRKPPQSQPQIPQSQPKPTGGIDLASPNSVSSDSSITNPLSLQRPPLIYQDPVVQISSGSNRVDSKLSDANPRNQMQQQVQDSGYVLQNHFDQQNHQLNQQQLNQLQQQQQFLQAGGTHYIHHHPTGQVSIPSYYPIYPHQQQSVHTHHALDQSYQMYYLPARPPPPQAYNLQVQQPNYSETATNTPSSRPQTPPPSAMMPPSAAYTTARNAQPLVQGPSSQHQPQYVGFSQIHHPSQSAAPASTATGNYPYEFVDPMHAQVYYTQQMAPPQLAAQYQTMTSAPAMVLPETSTQLPADRVKQ